MDEDDNFDRRGSASEDGEHPEKSLDQTGTLLPRRLAEATRTVSRIGERLRAEEDAPRGELAEGRLKRRLPENLPDFVGSEHEGGGRRNERCEGDASWRFLASMGGWCSFGVS